MIVSNVWHSSPELSFCCGEAELPSSSPSLIVFIPWIFISGVFFPPLPRWPGCVAHTVLMSMLYLAVWLCNKRSELTVCWKLSCIHKCHMVLPLLHRARSDQLQRSNGKTNTWNGECKNPLLTAVWGFRYILFFIDFHEFHLFIVTAWVKWTQSQHKWLVCRALSL